MDEEEPIEKNFLNVLQLLIKYSFIILVHAKIFTVGSIILISFQIATLVYFKYSVIM